MTKPPKQIIKFIVLPSNKTIRENDVILKNETGVNIVCMIVYEKGKVKEVRAPVITNVFIGKL